MIKNMLVSVLDHESVLKVDYRLGRYFFGNTARMTQNVFGYLDILRAQVRTREKITPKPIIDVNKLKQIGYHLVPGIYESELILNVQTDYLAQIENPDLSEPKCPGGDGKFYGRVLKNPIKQIPRLRELLNQQATEIVTAYYNANFHVYSISPYRIYHVPEKIWKEREVISNFWHCDSRYTSMLKFFINISDVTVDDGPLHIQSRFRTKELLKLGYKDRKNYALSKEIMDDPNHVIKLIGAPGTTIACNTEQCFHKAGLPAEGHTRDIIEIKFLPTYEPLTNSWPDKLVVEGFKDYN